MNSINHLKLFSKKWWQNLWFYYKWHILVVLVAIIAIVSTVMATINRVEPDIHILFGGDFTLTAQDQKLLKERVESTITDINGDGKIVAQLNMVSLALDKERFDETTAGSNQQLQTQFVTGKQHIYVFDVVNFNRFYAQDLLEPETLFEFTNENPLFEGTTLAEQDLIMVTRVKRHDMESDFTTSQQLIDHWATPNTQERFQEYVKNHQAE